MLTFPVHHPAVYTSLEEHPVPACDGLYSVARALTGVRQLGVQPPPAVGQAVVGQQGAAVPRVAAKHEKLLPREIIFTDKRSEPPTLLYLRIVKGFFQETKQNMFGHFFEI